MMANFGAGGQTGFVPDMMGNKAPELKVEGEKKRTAKVGEPVTLSAVATDDGKPKTRPMPAFLVGQSHFLPNAATGLRLSWFTYQGRGKDSVRSAADEGLAGPPGRRQFPLVGRLEHTAAAARKHVDGEGDVQRAGHLRAARARQRRRSHSLRRRDGDGRSLNRSVQALRAGSRATLEESPYLSLVRAERQRRRRPPRRHRRNPLIVFVRKPTLEVRLELRRSAAHVP